MTPPNNTAGLTAIINIWKKIGLNGVGAQFIVPISYSPLHKPNLFSNHPVNFYNHLKWDFTK